MDVDGAKKILRGNFIGPEELRRIAKQINIPDPSSFGSVPPISFEPKTLKKISQDFVLILGIPQNAQGKKLTLNEMRGFFGADPDVSEPCFYNQAWYLNEKFASETALEFKWYVIGKKIYPGSRGRSPEEITSLLSSQEDFPLAVLTAFTFFACFSSLDEILWKHDFIWCSDKDKNGDRIYAGRYQDPNSLNKNGFNIHRHLSIRSCYGIAPQIINL